MTDQDRLSNIILEAGIEEFMLSLKVCGNALEVITPIHLRGTFKLPEEIQLNSALMGLVVRGKVMKRKDIYQVR